MIVNYFGVYKVCLRDNMVSYVLKRLEYLIRIDMIYQEAVKKNMRTL